MGWRRARHSDRSKRGCDERITARSDFTITRSFRERSLLGTWDEVSRFSESDLSVCELRERGSHPHPLERIAAMGVVLGLPPVAVGTH